MRWTITIILFVAVSLNAFATPGSPKDDLIVSESNPTTNEKLICEPFGPCERCPETALHESFCQPFGNRRLLHCRVEGSPTSDGERPMFGPCGRIVARERADFFEFVFSNAVFLCFGLLVLFYRSRRLADMQARTLAARIGLTRVPRH